MYNKVAQLLKERLQRVNHDYLNFTQYTIEELNTRESEINAIAYELAEIFGYDKSFNRDEFMGIVNSFYDRK